MTDRVYSSSKPTSKPPLTTTTSAVKPRNQPPPYRRKPRRTRRCNCCCIFWYSVLIILFISLLAAISGTAFYVLYRPQNPTFSISTVKLSSFNLTTTTSDEITHLTSSFNLTLTSQNPTSKITFHYYPFTASLFSKSHTIIIANGSYPSFTTLPESKKIMKFKISTFRQEIDEDSVQKLETKNGFDLELRLDSKLRVKIGKFNSGKVGVRATCHGIHMVVRKSKVPLVTLASGSECKVDFRFKIWQFTI